MNELILKNICLFYEKYKKTRGYAEDVYKKYLKKLFYCKNTSEFEQLLFELIDFIKKCRNRSWRSICDTRAELFWHSDYDFGYMDLFSIVFLKRKELMYVLKENEIKYSNSSLVHPPIYKPLLERDIKNVDILVKNGFDIINEHGFTYFERPYSDDDIIDMVEILMNEKNTTSIRYIYENVPIKNILKYNERRKFTRYVYNYILPY